MCFSSYKNCELKVKLWWVVACQRKESAFFVTFIFSEGNFFNICVLSQCIMYWTNFQNIHTFIYEKTLLHTLLFLLFKMVENLQCILKENKGLISFCLRHDFNDLLLCSTFPTTMKYANLKSVHKMDDKTDQENY